MVRIINFLTFLVKKQTTPVELYHASMVINAGSQGGLCDRLPNNLHCYDKVIFIINTLAKILIAISIKIQNC